MAVGGLAMLTTASYEARKFGVRSAMPGHIALKLCPQLKIVPCNFAKYTEASNKVRGVIGKYDKDFLCVAPLDVSVLCFDVHSRIPLTTGL
jgi:DNA polymerase kappa